MAVFATCHPDRKHLAKGFCRSCYYRMYSLKPDRTKAKCHTNRNSVKEPEGLCYECYYALPKNKERHFKKRRLRVYGLTEKEYNELLALHNGKCAICSQPHTHLDHNHVTNKVRGLLCAKCNTGLGLFRDNPELLKLAAKYLEDTNG